MRTLEIEGVVSLAIGPASSENQVRLWAEQRGMKLKELSGPAYSVPQLDRIANKLKSEQDQLPSGVCNIVVLHCQAFTASPGSVEYFKEITDHLEEEIYKYPHIGFVALVFDQMIVNANSAHRLRDHFCLNRQRMDFVCDTTFFLKNRFANPAMSSELEARLVGAFTSILTQTARNWPR
jgi:hypothetical protein